MYYPIGWPVQVDLIGLQKIRRICCDRVKILFAILTDDSLAIYYTNPCVPIVISKRTFESIVQHGPNYIVEWKPDSNMLVVATTDGTLLLYVLSVVDTPKGIYNQIDPPSKNLCRDSAELFLKETIPSLTLTLHLEVPLYVPITCICCVNMTQMMVATKSERIFRIRWDGVEDRDFSLDLKRIPFSINQQVSYAVPILESNTYVSSMEYSPLIGGFAITLNDGRAAYLTANSLKFDPNQVQGIWAQGLDDVTCASINHKYRLIAFGRKNSQAVVYIIDDLTGGLELSHTIELSAKDFPGSPGSVREMKWTPDGCAVMLSWSKGGISLWSAFGAMLMCSLGWDYGLNVDLALRNPLDIICMDWSTEGYQLFMLRQQKIYDEDPSNREPSTANTSEDAVHVDGKSAAASATPIVPNNKPTLMHTYSNLSDKSYAAAAEPPYTLQTTLVQLNFVKSSFTVNPVMSTHAHLFLQGDDKLYINQGESLQKVYHNGKSLPLDPNLIDSSQYSSSGKQSNLFSQSYNICMDSYMSGEFISVPNEDLSTNLDDYEVGKSLQVTSILSESKHWIVVQLPIAYMATNWPIRFSAISNNGANIAVAGRTGVAMYSMVTRKWKLFGNETQEKDFIVTGGLLWWDDFIIMGCYSLVQKSDEIRLYPKDSKLDNRFAKIIGMAAPVMLINLFKDQLVTFTADGFVTVFAITKYDSQNIDLLRTDMYDIRGLCIHPACIISVTMTNLKNDSASRANQGNLSQIETLVLNVSGRILMVNKENNGNASENLTSTCLASCVECLWVSNSQKTHLKESLWLYCGGYGMRVWLPVFPRDAESGYGSRHTFMSKRIMLSFALKLYPLAILFEDAIILGVENDTVVYTSDSSSHFSLPFCILERASQVYLQQILRQLIRRNLGYNAWEIARSCSNLPYFPHSLELLLHEVLEEEATSKEPIADALLPSVLEFIQEFPVYLQTVVQCARKTEIALWPYLFATAGKPKDLFQQCLSQHELETAGSYLIILQNLEPSSVSRQFATILLETALEEEKWELAKELVRFLRAIDPNDVESPRNSFVMGNKLHLTQQPAPVSPNAEDLSLILGSMARGRSFSTTVNPKMNEIISPPSNQSQSNLHATGKAASVGSIDATSVVRRKKSEPHTAKEKDSTTAEEFFIEIIIQRHARRLLQDKKLEALGYMSAALDFHLVGWLAREKERAARIEDFVATLKQFHDDFDWPKPSLDIKLSRKSSERAQQQQESPSYSLQSLRVDTHMGTGDSGYTSLPTNLDFIHTDPNAFVNSGLSSMDSNHATDPLYSYNAEISNLALQQLSGKFNELSRITEEDTDGRSNQPSNSSKVAAAAAAHARFEAFRREPSGSVLGETEAKLMPVDTMSCVSEQVSVWGDDQTCTFNAELDGNFNRNMESLVMQNSRQVCHKLEVQTRYLLQIFTEACCFDFALLLSIILMDAASISRITSSAIRSGSLAICRQLRNGLKDVTRWSFQECLGYRPFMMMLQPQVNLLDRFVIQQESIPNFMPPLGARQPQMQFNRGDDGMINQAKNTQNMPTSKTAIEPIQTTIEHTRSGSGSIIGNRQKLNKSMSESQIDTSRIRQKYSRQTNLNEHSTSNETIGQNAEGEEEEAKNGCAIM